MKYILDTDSISFILKGNENVVNKFASCKIEILATTVINIAEIEYGLNKKYSKSSKFSVQVREFMKQINIANMNHSAAEVFGKLKSSLENKGNTIADMDLLIAAITIANNATLVTHNTRHFSRISGLKIIDWY